MEIIICGSKYNVRSFHAAKSLARRMGATRFETRAGCWGWRDGEWRLSGVKEAAKEVGKKEGWELYRNALNA